MALYYSDQLYGAPPVLQTQVCLYDLQDILWILKRAPGLINRRMYQSVAREQSFEYVRTMHILGETILKGHGSEHVDKLLPKRQAYQAFSKTYMNPESYYTGDEAACAARRQRHPDQPSHHRAPSHGARTLPRQAAAPAGLLPRHRTVSTLCCAEREERAAVYVVNIC